jgi:hypothetical protein
VAYPHHLVVARQKVQGPVTENNHRVRENRCTNLLLTSFLLCLRA